jgi:DNA invertase Pin-like site-specific DNA recombinase
MNNEANQKVTTSHLSRNAYLYVRQAAVRQSHDNTESIQHQYSLRTRAVALGWSEVQVIVIDSDLGQSGASAKNRKGFQKLVAEVGMGHAGIVLTRDVYRLTRNWADWRPLLQICALTDTLILDDSGIYAPTHRDDRLLLDMKGILFDEAVGGRRRRTHRGRLKHNRRRFRTSGAKNEPSAVLMDPQEIRA